ncbi:MAG TPA: hypothetical protein VFZ20_17365 [Longimicrobium sp.]|nr:hypothetical protein [Longimicrobium sp.]HEX6039825.1 hypothetical protein [Longimicrobium sp.]
MGRPRGAATPSTSGVHRSPDEATVVSVGPYMWYSAAPGSSSPKRRATAGARASPPFITRASDVHVPASGCSTNARSSPARCAVPIPSRRTRSTTWSGSPCPPGRAATMRAPVARGQKISRTDTSKLNEMRCSTASPGRSCHACWLHASRLATAR